MSNQATKPESPKTDISGLVLSMYDLKCGNILSYDTSEGETLPTVIDWQDLKWVAEDSKQFNIVHNPIYLSDEWLEKLGFSKSCDGVYKIRIGLDSEAAVAFDDEDFTKKQMTYRFTREPFFATRHIVVVCKSKIKYVHELQNLHYSLTGVMLSMN